MKRERFVEELDNYAKQVEELQEMGNIKELPRYYKKAQQLEQKLTQAADRVNLFKPNAGTYSTFALLDRAIQQRRRIVQMGHDQLSHTATDTEPVAAVSQTVRNRRGVLQQAHVRSRLNASIT